MLSDVSYTHLDVYKRQRCYRTLNYLYLMRRLRSLLPVFTFLLFSFWATAQNPSKTTLKGAIVDSLLLLLQDVKHDRLSGQVHERMLSSSTLLIQTAQWKAYLQNLALVHNCLLYTSRCV